MVNVGQPRKRSHLGWNAVVLHRPALVIVKIWLRLELILEGSLGQLGRRRLTWSPAQPS